VECTAGLRLSADGQPGKCLIEAAGTRLPHKDLQLIHAHLHPLAESSVMTTRRSGGLIDRPDPVLRVSRASPRALVPRKAARGRVTGSRGALSWREKDHAGGKAMRVFVTGATGALGQHLVPGLVAAGHEVTATTRTPGKAGRLRAAGAAPLVVDGLDRAAVLAAVRAAAPEVILHQMTALADMRSLRNTDRVFAATNELRTRGTDNLLAAAAEAGTRRVIAQSYTGWTNERSGGPVKTEDDPFDSRVLPSATRTLAAIKHVEKTVPLQAPEGIVLRYGSFYGPGASQVLLDLLRKRMLPVIGGGTGIWSFIEITDAAAATIAAVGRGAPDVYNVVDSDPAPVTDWLPYLARVAGAKPPLRVPAWLGRLLAGEFVVAQMTSARGSSNEKARKELGWEPRYASWREGFRDWAAG
jgi:nucleoside-diphosphate-sugar epimerase